MLRGVRCPVLAMQGERDEYGTLAQIEGIAQRVPATRMEVLADCGHSPQREQPELLAAMIAAFVAEHT